MCLSGLLTKGVVGCAVDRRSGFSGLCCHIISRVGKSGHLSDGAADSGAGGVGPHICMVYMMVEPLEKAGVELFG